MTDRKQIAVDVMVWDPDRNVWTPAKEVRGVPGKPCANGDGNVAVVRITSQRSTDGFVSTEEWCEFCAADYDAENEGGPWTVIKREAIQ